MEVGHAIEEVLYETLELCENDVVLTEQLIEAIAMATEVSEDWIIEQLESVDSLFTCNNPIQGFIKEGDKYKPYRRLTVFTTVKKTLEKHLKNFPQSERVEILSSFTKTHRITPLQFKEI